MTTNDLDRLLRLAEATTKAIARVERRIDTLEAAEPTTPEPDGLAERINRIASGQWDSINAASQRLDDHDAALAWMRNEIKAHAATLQGPFYEIAPAPLDVGGE